GRRNVPERELLARRRVVSGVFLERPAARVEYVRISRPCEQLLHETEREVVQLLPRGQKDLRMLAEVVIQRGGAAFGGTDYHEVWKPLTHEFVRRSAKSAAMSGLRNGPADPHPTIPVPWARCPGCARPGVPGTFPRQRPRVPRRPAADDFRCRRVR